MNLYFCYESRDTLKSLTLFITVKTITKLNVGHRNKFEKEFKKISRCSSRSSGNTELVMSRCFAEDGEEVYKEFCSLISNWFDMREQTPGAKLLHDSVSGASSLVCTEICFAGACFRSKLPRVYRP